MEGSSDRENCFYLRLMAWIIFFSAEGKCGLMTTCGHEAPTVPVPAAPFARDAGIFLHPEISSGRLSDSRATSGSSPVRWAHTY